MFCKVVFDVPLDRDFDYIVPDELAKWVHPGVRVTAPVANRLTGGLVTATSDISTAPAHIKLKPIASVVDQKPLFGSDLFPLMRYLKSHWGCPIGQILFALIPPQPYFKLSDPPALVRPTVKTPPFTLTNPQQKALDALEGQPAYEFNAFLLSGPAATGKTETILRAAGRVLSGYGQVLITVPDIVDARQFIKEVEALFGADNVYCWHSRMLLSQKKYYFSLLNAFSTIDDANKIEQRFFEMVVGQNDPSVDNSTIFYVLDDNRKYVLTHINTALSAMPIK